MYSKVVQRRVDSGVTLYFSHERVVQIPLGRISEVVQKGGRRKTQPLSFASQLKDRPAKEGKTRPGLFAGKFNKEMKTTSSFTPPGQVQK